MVLYMYGSQEKILGQKVNVKFFTVDTYSVGTGVPRTFLELGKIQKNIFLNIKTSTIKSEKNIYQTIHSTSFIFNFFGILLFFLDFSGFFENLNSIFWKNYANFLTLPQTTMSNFWLVAQFSRDPGYVRVSGKLSNQSKIAHGGLWKRENIFFFRNLVFAKLAFLINIITWHLIILETTQLVLMFVFVFYVYMYF